jgi:CheY-like chemotaxis protein
MLNELLNGFHVLIVSDHPDLANLFTAIVTACGATTMRASCVREAVEALRAQPHAVLLDVALEGDSWAVPVEADTRKIPVVALTLRCEEPSRLSGHLRALSKRVLHSTEMDEVCEVLHDAASTA